MVPVPVAPACINSSIMIIFTPIRIYTYIKTYAYHLKQNNWNSVLKMRNMRKLHLISGLRAWIYIYVNLRNVNRRNST